MALQFGEEGKITTLVAPGRSRTPSSRAPSKVWLGLAVASMAASAALVLSGRKQLGSFVGTWAPSILILGVYDRLSKGMSAPERAQGYA
jgi:hypothetical protein